MTNDNHLQTKAFGWYLPAVFLAALACVSPLCADPIQPNANNGNLVTWGNSQSTLNIIVGAWAPDDTLTFTWTANGVPSLKYAPYTAGNDTGKIVYGQGFTVPKDPTLTDVNLVNGTDTFTGVALANATNTFASLNNLPASPFQIPLLGPGAIKIYAYVNFTQYLADNPLGPLAGAYTLGDSLDGLGLDVVGGQIPGIQGLYFATSPFAYDPSSAAGYTPTGGSSTLLDSASYESLYGSLAVTDLVTGVLTPEPASFSLCGFALLGLGILGRRRRQQPV